jgi:predicted Zn-dependent peptidase
VQDPATAQELDRSRENLKGRLMLSLESTGARMSRLGSSLLAELPLLSLQELLDRIDAVTVEDLRELSAELLAPERLSLAGVGPDEARFHAAIEPLRTGAHELAERARAERAGAAAP